MKIVLQSWGRKIKDTWNSLVILFKVAGNKVLAKHQFYNRQQQSCRGIYFVRGQGKSLLGIHSFKEQVMKVMDRH